MLERHRVLYGQPPRQATADGSYASRDNLRQAKAQGVRDMAFHKKVGLRIEDMVRSHWVYRKLRNFRAGIEADISCLKRAYGLARCTWRGLGHFTRPTSGPRWSPTISRSSRASNPPKRNLARPADPITRRRPLPHASTSSNRCLTPPTRPTTRAKSSQSRSGMHNILCPSQKQAQHRLYGRALAS
jgi:IS5 family transposase